MKNFSFIYIIFAASLWGLEGVLFLPHLYSLPVALVVGIQTLCLSLLLTPFFYKRFGKYKKLSKSDWLTIGLIALLGGVIGILAITKAFFYVNYVNLSIVALLQKLQPLFAISFAALFLKEKLSKDFIAWAVVALLGAYLMTFGFALPNMETGGQVLLASGLALLAAASFGTTTVLSKHFLKKVEPLDGLYLRISVSTLILWVIIIFMGDYSALPNISSEQYTYFAAIIFLTGGMGIYLFNKGLKNTKASVSTICELAFPLTVILLEFVLRDKLLTLEQWLGVGVLLIAMSQIVGKK